MALLTTALLWGVQPPPTSRLLKQQALTMNARENPVINSAISTDGRYLVYAERNGISLKILATGEVRKIPKTAFAHLDSQFAWKAQVLLGTLA